MTSSQQGIPRKFSEKIAILERKQNEEEQQFHNVMRDVRALTNKAGGGVSHQMSPMSAYASQPGVHPHQLYDGSPQAEEIPAEFGGGNPHAQPFIIGAPPHPLAPITPWNRSLPNVHQSLSTNNINEAFTTWGVGGNQVQHYDKRTRSPGAHHHFHPYSNPTRRVGVSPPVDATRSPNGQLCSESHIQMMVPTSTHHLQPPDPSWSKARSDPAININSMASSPSGAYMHHPTSMQQWSAAMLQQQQQQHLLQQQQQQQQPTQVPSTAPVFDYHMFNGTVMSQPRPVMPLHPYPMPSKPSQQQQAFSYTPGLTLDNHPQHQRPMYPQPHKDHSDDFARMENICPLDISMGSLPNMHASTPHQQLQEGGGGVVQQQQQQQQQLPYCVSDSNHAPVNCGAAGPFMPQSGTHLVGAFDSMQIDQMGECSSNSNGRQIAEEGMPKMHSSNQHPGLRTGSLCQPTHQLTTPALLGPQSQSAPTSPAQTTAGSSQTIQQWPPNRHFSASPTSPEQLDIPTPEIPNIILTGPGGALDGTNLDWQDLQDLHLDCLETEIQRLLTNPNEGGVDPAVEQLLD